MDRRRRGNRREACHTELLEFRQRFLISGYALVIWFQRENTHGRFLHESKGNDNSRWTDDIAPLRDVKYARDAMADRGCAHLDAIGSVRQPEVRECVECVKIGASWVHLRTCQTCGVTLCCDSSPNRHASKHARASGHPVIASAQPSERWLYCYPDEAFCEY